MCNASRVGIPHDGGMIGWAYIPGFWPPRCLCAGPLRPAWGKAALRMDVSPVRAPGDPHDHEPHEPFTHEELTFADVEKGDFGASQRGIRFHASERLRRAKCGRDGGMSLTPGSRPSLQAICMQALLPRCGQAVGRALDDRDDCCLDEMPPGGAGR